MFASILILIEEQKGVVSATATPSEPQVIHYPDDDVLPIFDNTLQMKWIFLVYGSLIAQYRNHEDVSVAGNHLIYPVEGDNKSRQSPDVFVVLGRPKIERGSYRVWEEGGHLSAGHIRDLVAGQPLRGHAGEVRVLRKVRR